MNKNMVRTNDLNFRYDRKGEMLHFPDIALNTGESLLILGKSGIGKTTLLHLLAGLLRPVSGKVMIGDTQINSLSHSQLDTFRGQNMGLVFQKSHAIRSLNVFENLQARLFFSKKSINTSAINALLEQLNLSETKKNKVNKLSEGQLQRLAIAMGVIHGPQLILADEPTSSLDDENCNSVLQLLQRQADKNRANLVVITHDMRIKPAFKNVISL
jgi:putative ABC transport system ATP-binding protein